jgi:hypothetical protein
MEKMRPDETLPGMGGGGKRRMVEGVNATMIYCEFFYKYHNV